jgi:hypothetical protein
MHGWIESLDWRKLASGRNIVQRRRAESLSERWQRLLEMGRHDVRSGGGALGSAERADEMNVVLCQFRSASG